MAEDAGPAPVCFGEEEPRMDTDGHGSEGGGVGKEQEPAPAPQPIFEAVDCSDDERYYPIGLWLSLEQALADLDVADPSGFGSDGDPEGLFEVAVYQREIGFCDLGRKVATLEWRQVFDDTGDELAWVRHRKEIHPPQCQSKAGAR